MHPWSNAVGRWLSLVVAGLAMAGQAEAATAPSLLFDLTHFKLTLPVNAQGGPSGTAVDILPPELNGPPGYSSEYLYTGRDGAMNFVAPANGATTSPGSGSDHARSELREIYDLHGAANWTNAVGGTMDARLRIIQTAKRTDAAIIGQIHAANGVMMLLYYDANRAQLIARAWKKPGNAASHIYVLAGNVHLNDLISYSIQWIGSSLSITVNGISTNLISRSAWNGVPVYFKAGAYSAAPSSGNAAGDGTHIAFYTLHIQH